MALSEDNPSDGESVKSGFSVESLKTFYKCCAKKVCKARICINCDSVYHSSCAKRRNLKIINNTQVRCCDSMAANREATLELKVEYLNKIVSELKDKNSVLMENNSLLKQNNQLLLNQLKQLESNTTTYKPNVNIVQKSYADAAMVNKNEDKSYQQSVPATSAAVDSAPPELVSDRSEEKKTTGRVPVPGVPNQKVQNINNHNNQFSNLSNLNNNDRITNGNRTNRKKIKNSNRKIGSYEDGGDFIASKLPNKTKKIWLFISKVKNTIDPETVHTYILKHIPSASDTSVSVKLCNVKIPNPNHKSFMIGVDPEHKETVYKEDFWPNGVCFERFNFGRGRNFLAEG